MDHPDIAILQPRQDVLAEAVEPLHPLALKPGGEILGKRDTEVWTALFHPSQASAFEDRGKAAPYGLHFRQFEHIGVDVQHRDAAALGAVGLGAADPVDDAKGDVAGAAGDIGEIYPRPRRQPVDHRRLP